MHPFRVIQSIREIQYPIDFCISIANHLGKYCTAAFLVLCIHKQSSHAIRQVNQDLFDLAPFRDIREATAMLEFCNNLGIARIAVPDVENAAVCRQEPDVVCTEHVGKQLFGKSILGRILLVAKSQVTSAHEREPSERPGR